ncbi:hypothetical protein J7J84_06890 [bacterium]|nr:hypothetical protein [bacterium]
MIRSKLISLVLVLAMVAAILVVLAAGCSNPAAEKTKVITGSSAQLEESVDVWHSFSTSSLDIDFSQFEVKRHTPEYFAHLRGEGPDFRDRGNMTFHSPIVPYDELTDAEKMALYGLATSINSERFTFCNRADFTQSILNFYLEHGRTPEGPWELSFFEGDILREPGSELSLMRKLWWASPISGKPFDFTKTEFSPGNAYMQVVTDADILAYFDRYDYDRNDSSRFSAPLPPDPGERYLVYIRLYGINGIIAEGIQVWNLMA